MRHLLLALLIISACAGDDGSVCVDSATGTSASGETDAPFCADIPDGEPAYVAGFELGLNGPYPPKVNYDYCANADDDSPICILWWDGVGDGIKARARCQEQ